MGRRRTFGKTATGLETPTQVGRAEWRKTGHLLHEAGLLNAMDLGALETYCLAYARHREAEWELAEKGMVVEYPGGATGPSPWVAINNQAVSQMIRFMSDFGMTPASRSRLPRPSQGVRRVDLSRTEVPTNERVRVRCSSGILRPSKSRPSREISSLVGIIFAMGSGGGVSIAFPTTVRSEAIPPSPGANALPEDQPEPPTQGDRPNERTSRGLRLRR